MKIITSWTIGSSYSNSGGLFIFPIFFFFICCLFFAKIGNFIYLYFLLSIPSEFICDLLKNRTNILIILDESIEPSTLDYLVKFDMSIIFVPILIRKKYKSSIKNKNVLAVRKTNIRTFVIENIFFLFYIA